MQNHTMLAYHSNSGDANIPVEMLATPPVFAGFT
jgi:hypothetical protein